MRHSKISNEPQMAWNVLTRFLIFSKRLLHLASETRFYFNSVTSVPSSSTVIVCTNTANLQPVTYLVKNYSLQNNLDLQELLPWTSNAFRPQSILPRARYDKNLIAAYSLFAPLKTKSESLAYTFYHSVAIRMMRWFNSRAVQITFRFPHPC